MGEGISSNRRPINRKQFCLLQSRYLTGINEITYSETHRALENFTFSTDQGLDHNAMPYFPMSIGAQAKVIVKGFLIRSSLLCPLTYKACREHTAGIRNVKCSWATTFRVQFSPKADKFLRTKKLKEHPEQNLRNSLPTLTSWNIYLSFITIIIQRCSEKCLPTGPHSFCNTSTTIFNQTKLNGLLW